MPVSTACRVRADVLACPAIELSCGVCGACAHCDGACVCVRAVLRAVLRVWVSVLRVVSRCVCVRLSCVTCACSVCGSVVCALCVCVLWCGSECLWRVTHSVCAVCVCAVLVL